MTFSTRAARSGRFSAVEKRRESAAPRPSIQWAVLADDLTGALDTGVKFALRGASVRVVVDGTSEKSLPPAGSNPDVWVVNIQTRHASQGEAYRRASDWARELDGVTQFFYLKTDSTLRGNPGAEIAALMDAAAANIACFAPAYPDTGRTTRAGTQFLGGVPIHESEVARDPKNPITCGDIPQILRRGYSGPIHVIPAGERMPPDAHGICVFDARTNADLARIADALRSRGDARIYAGCAGFAQVIPLAIAKALSNGDTDLELRPPCLILSGSVHPRTLSQIERARAAGVACVGLSPRELREGFAGEAIIRCRRSLARGESVILASALSEADRFEGLEDREHRRIQAALAGCWMALPEGPLRLVIGGDTLQAVMRAMGESVVEPIAEPLPGMVLSRVGGGRILTRSGGFGQPEDLLRLCLGNP